MTLSEEGSERHCLAGLLPKLVALLARTRRPLRSRSRLFRLVELSLERVCERGIFLGQVLCRLRVLLRGSEEVPCLLGTSAAPFLRGKFRLDDREFVECVGVS